MKNGIRIKSKTKIHLKIEISIKKKYVALKITYVSFYLLLTCWSNICFSHFMRMVKNRTNCTTRSAHSIQTQNSPNFTQFHVEFNVPQSI